MDLHHGDKALTSRAASITDSKTNMKIMLPECYKVWSNQLGQCYKTERYEMEMGLANH